MNWFGKKKGAGGSATAATKTAREPRVRVVPLRGIHAQIEIFKERPVQMGNVSSSGVGFIVEPSFAWPEVGTALRGNFIFESEQIPFEGDLVHKTGQIIGVRFSGDNSKIRKMVLDHFDLELRARTMVEVRPEMLKEEPDGKPHWFRSANGFELFYVEGPKGEMIYYHLSFLGHYFESGRGRSLRYGNVVDLTQSVKPAYKGSEVVKFMSPIPTETRAAAIRMVENVSGLSEVIAKFLREQFSVD